MIVDNGSGMSRKQLRRLLENAYGDREHGGFGIYNVNERLKRHYGQSYQFAYSERAGRRDLGSVGHPAKKSTDRNGRLR